MFVLLYIMGISYKAVLLVILINGTTRPLPNRTIVSMDRIQGLELMVTETTSHQLGRQYQQAMICTPEIVRHRTLYEDTAAILVHNCGLSDSGRVVTSDQENDFGVLEIVEFRAAVEDAYVGCGRKWR